jgi:hypothetical protein
MTEHPYSSLPNHAYWRRAIANKPVAEIDPVTATRFTIGKSDKVATAGSCFAQHIARHLAGAGFTYFVAEDGHPLIPRGQKAAFNYGVFSARYGNVYTTRQLLQLFDRAFGRFVSHETFWRREDGRYLDPFRPQISPDGFATTAEAATDRAFHLSCVRKMFETLDVFIFTLGLTECFASRQDGAVFPVCPGVSGGVFDPARYHFVNFSVAETTRDLDDFLHRLRHVNPRAKTILTVSPVPLMATAGGQHVLTATTYSKSVLRVACEEVIARHDGVDYFPSYEIITGQYHRGRYFGEDLRSVTEEGVAHVMRVFLRHYAADAASPAATLPAQVIDKTALSEKIIAETAKMVDVVCDEEALDPGRHE